MKITTVELLPCSVYMDLVFNISLCYKAIFEIYRTKHFSFSLGFLASCGNNVSFISLLSLSSSSLLISKGSLVLLLSLRYQKIPKELKGFSGIWFLEVPMRIFQSQRAQNFSFSFSRSHSCQSISFNV